jgi:hypothetical protein
MILIYDKEFQKSFINLFKLRIRILTLKFEFEFDSPNKHRFIFGLNGIGHIIFSHGVRYFIQHI